MQLRNNNSPVQHVLLCFLVQVVQDLISRALSAPLLPAQQQAVLTQLEADPKLVHYIGRRAFGTNLACTHQHACCWLA
jgi:hypothetical protein